jgi:hypothetical protein
MMPGMLYSRMTKTFELLFRAARLVNERALAGIRDNGGTSLRLAHTQLFPHVTFAGVRLTEIADRLQVTKQAIGPLIEDLSAKAWSSASPIQPIVALSLSGGRGGVAARLSTAWPMFSNMF